MLKTNKSKMVIFCLIAAISLFIPIVILKEVIKRAFKPSDFGNYLYSYGYGGFAKTFLIILIIVLVLYVALLTVLIIKKKYLIKLILNLFFFLTVGVFFGYLIISIKESRSLTSYTTDIDNYGIYDEILIEELTLIENLLPSKNTVTKYEYFLRENRTIFGFNNVVTIYIKTNYFEEKANSIINSEDYSLVENIDDYNFKGYDLYHISLYNSDLNKQNARYLYVLVSQENDSIIYGIVSSDYYFFNQYENNHYVFGFVSGDRSFPYHKYIIED